MNATKPRISKRQVETFVLLIGTKSKCREEDVSIIAEEIKLLSYII